MSIRPARIRAVVVAVLVLAFVIPWTYAHIAYAWPWKRFQTGTLISCDDQYLVGGFPALRILGCGGGVGMGSGPAR